jgi:hypothetical protein
LLRDDLLQSQVLLLELFEALGLVALQSAVLIAPPVERVGANPQLFANQFDRRTLG